MKNHMARNVFIGLIVLIIIIGFVIFKAQAADPIPYQPWGEDPLTITKENTFDFIFQESEEMVTVQIKENDFVISIQSKSSKDMSTKKISISELERTLQQGALNRPNQKFVIRIRVLNKGEIPIFAIERASAEEKKVVIIPDKNVIIFSPKTRDVYIQS